MTTQRATSGSPYEKAFGFCRALRRGQHVFVSGTAPIAPDGTTATPGDAAGQMRRCCDIIVAAPAQLGAKPADVVRTRIILTDISKWDEVGRVHGDYFGEARPVTTMVEAKGLIRADWLVELEAEALLEE